MAVGGGGGEVRERRGGNRARKIESASGRREGVWVSRGGRETGWGARSKGDGGGGGEEMGGGGVRWEEGIDGIWVGFG